MMFRTSQTIRKALRNISDSFRFMSISDRRRLYYCFSGLTAVSCTGLYFVTQTTYNEAYREQLQMYRNNMPITVPFELIEQLKTVISDTGVNIPKNSSVSLFHAVGCDLYSFGSVLFSSGAHIGLPFNYTFHSQKNFIPSDLRLIGQFKTKQSMESPLMKRLSNALVLSPEAKKYAIGHQLNLVSSSYFYMKCLNIFTFTLGGLLLSSKVRNLLQTKNRYLKLSSSVCCLFLVAFTGISTDQLLDYLYDLRSMKLVISQTGPEYHSGAIEFYQKLIERNQVLHELLGNMRFFDEDGSAFRLFGLVRQSYHTNLTLLANMQQKALC